MPHAPQEQIEKLRALLLEKELGPRRHGVINRKYVGKNVDVILRDASGVPKPKLDAAGQPVPFKIAYPEKDDQGKPDLGKSLLATAYSDDKSDLAVGPTSSGVAR